MAARRIEPFPCTGLPLLPRRTTEAIDQKRYQRPFTTDQMARLKAVFPEGVCDYSRPGVEQRRVSGSWKRY